MLHSNQRGNYKKVGIGYQPSSNDKSLKNTLLAKKRINHNIFKCNYYGKNCHIDMDCFNKINDLK